MRGMRAAAFLLAVAGSAAAAAAETLKVPSDDYPTIQSAVDAAATGDVILVSSGVYAETVSIVGRTGITLKGKGYPTIQPGAAVGIDISGCEDVSVSGFEVYQCTNGVQVGASEDVSISKMVVSGSTAHAFGLSNNAGVLISKCEVNGTGSNGVDDSSSDDVTVEKCRFQGVSNIAVRLSSSNLQGNASDRAKVSKNRVDGANSGLHLGGENILVEKNRIEVGSGYGIYFDGSSSPSNAIITRNVVVTTANQGIVAYGEVFEISRNRLTGGGITEYGYAHTIDRNSVTGGVYGIYMNGSGSTVTGNTIRGSQSAGIYVNEYYGAVSGNKVFDSLGDGIVLLAPGEEPVAGNRVSGSANTGVRVTGNSITVAGNVSTGSNFFGFYVTGINNTFSANRAAANDVFDLADSNAPGTNTYDETNKFGTTQIPYID